MAVLAHEGTHTVIFGMVSIPIGSAFHDAYLARPDSAERSPTVVILHGIAGLDSATKQLCRSFSRHGFTAIAPDWYLGAGPGSDDQAEAFRAYGATSDVRILRLISETVEYMASGDVGGADASAPVVLGLDLGGRFALLFASGSRTVSAVASLYGPLHGDESRDLQVANAMGAIGVPVLGLYGADDDLVPVEHVDEAQAATPNGQWILYEGVGHGFIDAGHDGYDPGAEADALVRLVRMAELATT